MKTALCIALAVLFLGESVTAGQDAGCVFNGSDDKTRGKPVIFGKEVTVPSLKLHFVRKQTGQPVTPAAVDIHYYWQWIAHPYPEHSSGAWVDAEERLKCTPRSSEMIVPARTIQPRGWYIGRYTSMPWQKPKLSRVEIVTEVEGCAPRLIIEAGELARFKNTAATLILPCAGRAEVKFEPSTRSK